MALRSFNPAAEEKAGSDQDGGAKTVPEPGGEPQSGVELDSGEDNGSREDTNSEECEGPEEDDRFPEQHSLEESSGPEESVDSKEDIKPDKKSDGESFEEVSMDVKSEEVSRYDETPSSDEGPASPKNAEPNGCIANFFQQDFPGLTTSEARDEIENVGQRFYLSHVAPNRVPDNDDGMLFTRTYNTDGDMDGETMATSQAPQGVVIGTPSSEPLTHPSQYAQVCSQNAVDLSARLTDRVNSSARADNESSPPVKKESPDLTPLPEISDLEKEIQENALLEPRHEHEEQLLGRCGSEHEHSSLSIEDSEDEDFSPSDEGNEGNEGKTPHRSTISGDPIAILVGPARTKITVSTNLAHFFSPYLSAAISRCDQDPLNGNAVVLKHADPDAFGLFKVWLHHKDTGHYDAALLLKAYRLGEKLEAHAFRNFVMNSFYDSFFSTKLMPAPIINAIYQQTPSGHKLRRLLVDMAATKWRAAFGMHKLEAYPTEFLYDFGLALSRPRMNAKIPKKDDREGVCRRYHEHDREENNQICYTAKPGVVKQNYGKGVWDAERGEWTGYQSGQGKMRKLKRKVGDPEDLGREETEDATPHVEGSRGRKRTVSRMMGEEPSSSGRQSRRIRQGSVSA